ncbi:MAG: hypothetical protein J2P23_07540 [Microlunatus sp.]|nr:hypothetical protein [Microlunatus sp.]
MPVIEIRELPVPASEGAPGWDDLVAYAELSNDVLCGEIGTPDLDERPAQLLARLNDPYASHQVFGAFRGGRLAGFAEVEIAREQTIAWIWAGVAAAERGAGVGVRLAEVFTDAATRAGATTLQAGSYHADLDSEPRLPSPAGPGSVPADAATTRFLQAQGFKLGQVEIMSALPLPVPGELLAGLSGAARPADDYEVIEWSGRTPEDWVEGYAELRTKVTTAVPTGELTEEEQIWDADRVRNRDDRNARAGVITQTTAARHRPTGELVAFTGLARPALPDGRAVMQGYTMVLPEHRGHNLGLRIKINNIRQLMAADHGAARIITGNAGENEAMLRINQALGFRPFVMTGWWEKKLTA